MGMKKQTLSDNTICSAYFYTIFIIICRNSPEHEKTVTPLSVYCAIYEYILFSQILLFNIPWFYMNNPKKLRRCCFRTFKKRLPTLRCCIRRTSSPRGRECHTVCVQSHRLSACGQFVRCADRLYGCAAVKGRCLFAH